MRIGAHVPAKDPFGGAELIQAEVVQLHLSAPRQWRAPKEREDAQALCDAGIVACVHAPYLCNPASGDPEVRRKTTKVLQETLDEAVRCGARGVVVHAGHAAGGGDMEDALARWVEVARPLRSDVPLLIENTASGQTAPGRHLADIERLFGTLHGADLDVPLGACFDTCHAWAGDPDCGDDPATWVKRLAAAAGGIDIVHVNDSKDPAGAGRDRHQNLGEGEIGLEVLGEMVRAAADAGAHAAVVETPSGGEAHLRDLELVRGMLT